MSKKKHVLPLLTVGLQIMALGMEEMNCWRNVFSFETQRWPIVAKGIRKFVDYISDPAGSKSSHCCLMLSLPLVHCTLIINMNISQQNITPEHSLLNRIFVRS